MKILFTTLERLFLADFLKELVKEFGHEMLRTDRRELNKLAAILLTPNGSLVNLKPKYRSLLLQYVAAGVDTMESVPEPTEQTKYSAKLLRGVVEKVVAYEQRYRPNTHEPVLRQPEPVTSETTTETKQDAN